jgi:hypothetical protein
VARWTFTYKQGIEPTNNTAERALRPALIYRKLSFGTQSASGSRYLERILSVSETCRLQNRNAYQFLIEAMLARLLKGNRSEKQLVPSPLQPFLPFEDQAELEAAQAEAEAEAEALLKDKEEPPQAKPRKRRSEALPPHLPRKERIVELPESLAVCPLHGAREVMGYDVVDVDEHYQQRELCAGAVG